MSTDAKKITAAFLRIRTQWEKAKADGHVTDTEREALTRNPAIYNLLSGPHARHALRTPQAYETPNFHTQSGA